MCCTPGFHISVAFSHICKLINYANLFCTNKNIKVLFKTINKEVHYVNEWFIASKSVNAGKIKYILLHKQIARDSIRLRLPSIKECTLSMK